MRRALALIAVACLVPAAVSGARAQVNPPVAAPSGPVNPAGAPTGAPAPDLSAPVPASPTDGATPAAAAPATGEATPATGEATPAAGEATPASGESSAAPEQPTPVPTPTQPPIVIDPPAPGVEPGRTILARINSALGDVTATVADPNIATAVVDQAQRALYITGVTPGTTTITVTDERGVTRDVPVRVAFRAGAIADDATLRVTGDPASAIFVRDAVTQAAEAAATLRSGARVTVAPEAIQVHGDLSTDNRAEIDVPMQISGDGYFTAIGTTRVSVENFALPKVHPAQLMVSDYPERLTADGVLFTATIDRNNSQRFLYYHFNPGNEKPRRILVKATNASNTPAVLHLIASQAGPGSNEMEVGHNATKMFLVREHRNEGTVVTIPANSTINVVNHSLPPNSVVNGIMQIREVSGDPIAVAIVAQDATAPLDQSPATVALLSGGAPHARGVYPVPEFFSDFTFFVDGPELEIPIGELPLPNLREGEALSGDYGVKQSMRVVIVNSSRYGQAIALYANPRGGGATGTFLIDNTLVQAHRLTAFSKFKIWQETIAPNTYRTLQITTMPEGGSSYPLRLIFAADDGSVAPGAPGSPIY